MLLKIFKLLCLIYLYFIIKYPFIIQIIKGLTSLLYILVILKRILFYALIPWCFCYVTVIYFKHSCKIYFFFLELTYLSYILILFLFFLSIIYISLSKKLANNFYLNIIYLFFIIILFGQYVSNFIFNPYSILTLNHVIILI